VTGCQSLYTDRPCTVGADLTPARRESARKGVIGTQYRGLEITVCDRNRNGLNSGCRRKKYNRNYGSMDADGTMNPHDAGCYFFGFHCIIFWFTGFNCKKLT
jgi:hypothetical protein